MQSRSFHIRAKNHLTEDIISCNRISKILVFFFFFSFTFLYILFPFYNKIDKPSSSVLYVNLILYFRFDALKKSCVHTVCLALFFFKVKNNYIGPGQYKYTHNRMQGILCTQNEFILSYYSYQ